MKGGILVGVLVVCYLVNVGECRDLFLTVVKGVVQAKDTFTSDPYMSVTVCKEKKRTPTVHFTNHPEWNWSYQFRNVQDNCRIKFHLYDSDALSDDSMGEIQMTLGQFMREGSEERTLFLGKKSQNKIVVRARYV